MVVADAERRFFVEAQAHAEVEADDIAGCDLADVLAAVFGLLHDVRSGEVVQVADRAEEHGRVGREQHGQRRLQAVEARAGRQRSLHAVTQALDGGVGPNVERVLASARFEPQAANVERVVDTALVELVPAGHLDIADAVAGGAEDCAGGATLAQFAADVGVGPVRVRQARFHFEPVRDAVAARERGVERVALDLAHIDEPDRDRRDDRVADQRDPVARRVRILQRRFEHGLALGREDARLLEDRRDGQRAAFRFGRLAHGLGCARVGRGLRHRVVGRHAARTLRGQHFDAERAPHFVQAGLFLSHRAAQRFEASALRVDLALQRFEARIGGCVGRVGRVGRAGGGQRGTGHGAQVHELSRRPCHHRASQVARNKSAAMPMRCNDCCQPAPQSTPHDRGGVVASARPRRSRSRRHRDKPRRRRARPTGPA